MLSGSWLESSSDKATLTLHFDNPHITFSAFKVVLGRMYGVFDVNAVNEKTVIDVLATASYFQDEDLCLYCQEFIEYNLSIETVAEFIQHAHENNYGTHSDKIIEAGLLYLCKNCNSMDPLLLQNVPEVLMGKVLASDALFVSREMDRFNLFRTSINSSDVCCSNIPGRLLSVCESVETLVDATVEMSCEDASNDEKESNLSAICQDYLIPAYMNSTEMIEYQNWSGQTDSTAIKLRTLIETRIDSPESTLGLQYSAFLINKTGNQSELDPRKVLDQIQSPIRWTSLEFPPFRFGVEFTIDQLDQARNQPGTNVYTSSTFHAGSMWLLYCKVSAQNPTFGIFLQRVPATNAGLWIDKRPTARVWFQVTAYSAQTQRVLDTTQTFKQPGCWGWPAFFTMEHAYQDRNGYERESSVLC
ncbi:hypothetical protein BCR33DRAFT_350951 [Rhizoclosmatium globosum]|uniref:BTB domain-containing protein n=1 Tax=Rhizoclosmatium globosum TaxID=329046 RepID=A0A1Y2C1U9_9FUNG|nr:hypothetical protein BCR33DRAFT_350951 [Rhizoclosmatium globosum]|eukprot:ORY40981.1 hypothetical protein BCR33DRAFT_350951 [Rhizoclosmatium globosum]